MTDSINLTNRLTKDRDLADRDVQSIQTRVAHGEKAAWRNNAANDSFTTASASRVRYQDEKRGEWTEYVS